MKHYPACIELFVVSFRNQIKLFHVDWCLHDVMPKELCALRGYFGLPLRLKTKVALHHFLLFGLLEQLSKCKCLVLILLLPLLW